MAKLTFKNQTGKLLNFSTSIILIKVPEYHPEKLAYSIYNSLYFCYIAIFLKERIADIHLAQQCC
jgi:hypothetical protein